MIHLTITVVSCRFSAAASANDLTFGGLRRGTCWDELQGIGTGHRKLSPGGRLGT